MNEESVERIAAELARLAEALRALGQPALPAAAESLAHTAPPDLAPLVRQTLTALAQLLPGEGVRVLLAGLHRRGDRTTSWYQFLSEKDAQEALQNPAGLRALTLLAQPERLRLLFALVQGVQGAAEAMEKSGLTQGQFYHHLRALEAAGLVRKLGRDRYTPTLSGTSALFTLLALVDHLGREAEEEG
ncbi:MAG: transcriptional regulator [Candidatus Bipolaricaulota bacterium]|nr:transcriptional regulator [Candidatus Bipolaricaulota bacterium]